MGMMLPPFYFNNATDMFSGTPNGSISEGIQYTAGTSNSDGTAVTLLSALAHDVHFLVFASIGSSTGGSSYRSLGDILIDPAGGTSWANFIDDLVIGGTQISSAGGATTTAYYMFPIFIKAGSSIGFRARTSHTVAASNSRAYLWVYGNPSRPDAWWCGQKVESIGINASTSSGTDITPGDSGSFGSWTDIAATGASYGAVQFGLGISSSTLINARAYHWEVGYSSTKLPGSPTFWAQSNTVESTRRVNFQSPIWCDIPSGTTMQARSSCSGTHEGTWDVAVYGVY